MNSLIKKLHSLNIKKLQLLSNKLEIPPTGNKKQIIERILKPLFKKYKMNTKSDGKVRGELKTFEGYPSYDMLQNQEILIEKMFTNLLKLKDCRTNYKYCETGNYVGDCIHETLNCRDNIINNNKKYPSKFKLFILNLEKRKMTIDSYNYNYQYKNQFTMKYKFPKPGQIHNSYYLVQIDINKLKEYMGESHTDVAAHNKIYTKNNIELLSWLLAGLHNQNLNSDKTGIRFIQSYIKYYFTNVNSFLKVPILNFSNGIFHIVDGRHRLGFYNYFNINGLILTNKNGIDTLSKYNMNINSVTIQDAEVNEYFYKNIFNNIQNVKNKSKQITTKYVRKMIGTIKCRKCGGKHWTKNCVKISK